MKLYFSLSQGFYYTQYKYVDNYYCNAEQLKLIQINFRIF
ncbi:hypothetical protein Xekj_02423 [Xenorhabdus sp. KJ12.1]|nr:hypothetical protein Xekj_02423 [Xenorhabdus sp. KJ12.1]